MEFIQDALLGVILVCNIIFVLTKNFKNIIQFNNIETKTAGTNERKQKKEKQQ